LNENSIWNPAQKFAFRLVFILLPSFAFFYSNVFESDFLFWLQSYPAQLIQPIINFIGKYILSAPDETTFEWKGGGDTISDYLLILTLVIISVAGSTIWTFIDKERKNYYQLYYWLEVIIRYYLALILMQYGLAKVIKTQFPFPGLDTLTKTYGDSSPMNLAWTFFGFSKGYNLFMGFVELLGMLLIYRRTVTIGALISLGTTINIMAINYFYDVPVKILSTALVLMCLFLLTPNFKRIWDFFVLSKPSALIVFNPVVHKKPVIRALLVVKIMLIGVVFFITIQHVKSRERIIGDNAVKTPLYGIYEVETFVINNDTLPPLLTDDIRWKQLVINWPGNARITFMNDKSYYDGFKVDTSKKQIALGYEANNLLNYKIPDQNHLIIYGKLNEDSISVIFNKIEHSNLKLINRGFHWITEVPFNQ